jgi:hypothetical protein
MQGMLFLRGMGLCEKQKMKTPFLPDRKNTDVFLQSSAEDLKKNTKAGMSVQ